jgi:hypothetical protein
MAKAFAMCITKSTADSSGGRRGLGFQRGQCPSAFASSGSGGVRKCVGQAGSTCWAPIMDTSTDPNHICTIANEESASSPSAAQLGRELANYQ